MGAGRSCAITSTADERGQLSLGLTADTCTSRGQAANHKRKKEKIKNINLNYFTTPIGRRRELAFTLLSCFVSFRFANKKGFLSYLFIFYFQPVT